MSKVDLSDQQWGQLMAILSDAPWKIANPLLMEIGNQLRAQHEQGTLAGMMQHPPSPPNPPPRKEGNGGQS